VLILVAYVDDKQKAVNITPYKLLGIGEFPLEE
jgi:hypothetical protein